MKRNEERFIDYQKFLDKILWFTLIYMLIIPIAVYLLVLGFSNLPNNQFFNTLIVSNSETWILFFGALFGGSLTVFGVLFSIVFSIKLKKDEKLEEEVLELTKNRPYIYAESISKFFALANILYADIKIRNLTATPIRELTVKSINSKVYTSEIDYEFSNSIDSDILQFIPEKDFDSLRIKAILPEISKEGDYSLKLAILLQFHNLTGELIFTHTVYAHGNVKIRMDERNAFNITEFDFSELYNEFNWDI